MTPVRSGQIVKFHTPLPDENPDQLYVTLHIIGDDIRPRADIQALNTGLALPPVNTVLLADLEVVDVATDNLLGHTVTVNKPDYSQVVGRVVKISEQKIDLDLSAGVKGVETNVWLTVLDKDGIEHRGTLFVTPQHYK